MSAAMTLVDRLAVRVDQAQPHQRQVLSNVQVLRFIAAMAVLIGHTADILLARDSLFWSLPWIPGVDVFFVVSGFIMAHLARGQFGQPGAARAFLLRRLVRIVPPYWFFTLLLAAVILASGGRIRNSAAEPQILLTSLAFVPWPRIDGLLNPLLSQGWTLNFEMFFYVAFALALILRRGLGLLVAAFVCLVAMHPFVPEETFLLHFWTRPIILEFIVGIGLARLYGAGWRLTRSGLAACAVLVMILTAATKIWELGQVYEGIWRGVPATFIAAGFILAPEPRQTGPLRRFLEFGGDASYTLYLSHTLVMAAFVQVWLRTLNGPPWLGVVGGVAVSIGFALAFYNWAERPVTARLRKLVPASPQ